MKTFPTASEIKHAVIEQSRANMWASSAIDAVDMLWLAMEEDARTDGGVMDEERFLRMLNLNTLFELGNKNKENQTGEAVLAYIAAIPGWGRKGDTTPYEQHRYRTWLIFEQIFPGREVAEEYFGAPLS